MHWVLVYFLVQPIGIVKYTPAAAAGGVGQIRFRTEAACQSFYHELEKKYKPQSVNVKGVCMLWSGGSLQTHETKKHFYNR